MTALKNTSICLFHALKDKTHLLGIFFFVHYIVTTDCKTKSSDKERTIGKLFSNKSKTVAKTERR